MKSKINFKYFFLVLTFISLNTFTISLRDFLVGVAIGSGLMYCRMKPESDKVSYPVSSLFSYDDRGLLIIEENDSYSLVEKKNKYNAQRESIRAREKNLRKIGLLDTIVKDTFRNPSSYSDKKCGDIVGINRGLLSFFQEWKELHSSHDQVVQQKEQDNVVQQKKQDNLEAEKLINLPGAFEI